MKPKNKKECSITIRISPKLKAKCKMMSDKYGYVFSESVRIMLESVLEDEKRITRSMRYKEAEKIICLDMLNQITERMPYDQTVDSKELHDLCLIMASLI